MSTHLMLHSPPPRPPLVLQECPPIDPIGSGQNLLNMSLGVESAQCPLHSTKPIMLECLVKKEGRAVRKRWQEWKQLEGKDIFWFPTFAAWVGRASTARRLYHANRDSYKLFTLGPHCGHFPCRASLHGAPGSWRARVGCQREDWRLEIALFPNTQADVVWIFGGRFGEKGLDWGNMKWNQTGFTLETSGDDKTLKRISTAGGNSVSCSRMHEKCDCICSF